MTPSDSIQPDSLPPGISAIIPVYNSQETLSALLDRLLPILEKIDANHEVILVNDGSRDGSWKVIEGLRSRHPRIVGFDMMRNYGQHNALLCGIRAARFDTIVTLDDDLQNPPEEVPKMLAKLAEGFDVVYGKPQAMHHGLFRNLASKITKSVLQTAMGADTAGNISAFRVFRTAVRGAFATYRSPFVSIDVLLTWGTTRFTAIDVRHEPRTIGTSNYTLRKLMVHALNMVTGFSTFPLQVASWIGFLSFLFGMAVFVWVVVRYLLNGSEVHGFTFLASLVAILSGTQLLLFGVMGEYLARMHFRMMDRPTYAVRTTIGGA